jgi:hypothetical protein
MTTAATWPDDGSQTEIPLLGGDVTEDVVRVGDTVRRPLKPNSPLIHALLTHLEAVGFTGAPRFLGIDAAGREVLSYIEGEVAGRPRPPWIGDEDRMVSVARLVLDGIGHALGAQLATISAVMLLRLGVNRLAQAAIVAPRAARVGRLSYLLPGPFVYVTVNSLMDFLQMGQVVARGDRRPAQQDQGPHG